MKHQPSPASNLDELQDGDNYNIVADEASTHNGRSRPTHLVARKFLGGSILFLQGDEPDGVFFLHHGRVQLSIDSAVGRSLIVRIAEPGDIVGISGVLNGTRHEVTALALEFCRADFVPRKNFIRRLHSNAGLCWHAANELSRESARLFGLIHALAGSDTVFVRLARLFASWLPEANGHRSRTIENHLTHQQIAEMIGTTRETVTRALGEMREQNLLTLKNGALAIHDHEQLRRFAANGAKPSENV